MAGAGISFVMFLMYHYFSSLWTIQCNVALYFVWFISTALNFTVKVSVFRSMSEQALSCASWPAKVFIRCWTVERQQKHVKGRFKMLQIYVMPQADKLVVESHDLWSSVSFRVPCRQGFRDILAQSAKSGPRYELRESLVLFQKDPKGSSAMNYEWGSWFILI